MGHDRLDLSITCLCGTVETNSNSLRTLNEMNAQRAGCLFERTQFLSVTIKTVQSMNIIHISIINHFSIYSHVYREQKY